MVNSRTDLQKYLLATSRYGDFIQEKISTIVNHGKYNHAMVRRALDEEKKGLLQYGTPLSVTFKDAKKFDIQNPIISGLLSQVEANKLEDNILKQKPEDLKNREIASRLTGLRLPSCKYIYIIIIIVIIITIIIIITIVKDLVIWVLEVVSHLFYLLKELPFL